MKKEVQVQVKTDLEVKRPELCPGELKLGTDGIVDNSTEEQVLYLTWKGKEEDGFAFSYHLTYHPQAKKHVVRLQKEGMYGLDLCFCLEQEETGKIKTAYGDLEVKIQTKHLAIQVDPDTGEGTIFLHYSLMYGNELPEHNKMEIHIKSI